MLSIHQRRRDWFQIIRVDLTYAGIPMAKVAKICNRDPKTVEHWTLDGEPKDTDARIILALYQKFCPQKFYSHMVQIDPEYVGAPVIASRPSRPKRCFCNEFQLELFAA